ncbi:cytidylate kinase family protein [Candidatus Uhrbacteria bacterium]|nr:cytidylate kinase family protein [Candidatus Uhrbacteria bacterium]
MIITISGVPGSGKTTVAKILSDKLGMPFYSMGGLRAKLAEERRISIDELNAIGEIDPTTDTSVDEYQRELGKTKDNFIVEGRLSWHFIPHSIKIFLSCDLDEAAKRIFDARKNTKTREDEAMYRNVEETRRAIEERTASDVRRYALIYGVDYRDAGHYDFVIDTTTLAGPEATAAVILEKIEAKR